MFGGVGFTLSTDMGKARLIVYDFMMSFMWVWSGVLVKMFVSKGLGMGRQQQAEAEILKGALFIVNMFFFAFLAKLTNGGAYNPLTVLSSAVSGDFAHFLFTVGAKIPAQVTSLLPSFDDFARSQVFMDLTSL